MLGQPQTKQQHFEEIKDSIATYNLEIRAVAKAYFELGPNVPPVGSDRKPLCAWEKQIADKQRLEDANFQGDTRE